MSRLEDLSIGSPSRTCVLSSVFYLTYFFLLNFLLISRGASALFEFPYVLLLVVPYILLATSAPLMGLGIYVIYSTTKIKSLAPSYGGLLTLSTLLDLGLLAALIVHIARHRTVAGIKDSLSKLVFLFTGSLFVSALARKSLYQGGGIGIRSAALMSLLYVCTVLFLNARQRILQMLRVFLFLALAWSGLSIYHVLRFGIEDIYTRTTPQGGYLEQIIDVNSLAVSVLMVLPLLYFQITLKQRLGWTLLALFSTTLSVCTVILTFSRNGFINLAVVLALIFLKDKRSPRVWAIFAVLLIVILLAPQQYWVRMLSTSGIDTYKYSMAKGISAKLLNIQRGIDIIRHNPLTGIGTGMLDLSIHNSIVQVAVEMGLPVMLLYISIIFAAFKGLQGMRLRSKMSSDSLFSKLPYLLTISLVAYIIGGLTINIYWYLPFFIILGMIVAMKTLETKAIIGD